MRIARSEARLNRMLAEAGISTERPSAGSMRAVLEVFREFSEIPVRGLAPKSEDGDGVLAQFGTYAFTGSPLFTVGLTRQFTKRGEDPPMWQLDCAVEWSPTEETDVLGSGDHWSFGVEPGRFYQVVSGMAGFRWALTTARPPDTIHVDLQRV